MDRIYLSSPHMCGKEMEYIADAFKKNWIAPLGENVDEFEKSVAKITGRKYGAATVSGTAAIHLALKWLGIRQGDYVFCSSLTFSGSCNAIAYEKAHPVFIDAEPDFFNMSETALKKAFACAKKNDKLPKAAIIVNIYGQSAEYEKLLPLCKKYNVPVIEDAAESLGASYQNEPSGCFGDLSVLSFNGNKIITTSGGGMLLSDDEQAIKKAKFWSTQARDPAPHYQHSEIGYNYRLSNISAGIGRGQLLCLKKRIEQKKHIYDRYAESFEASDMLSIPKYNQNGVPNFWLTVALLKNKAKKPIDIINALAAENIEARPIWKPMNLQPVFADCDFFSHYEDENSAARYIFENGLCLPSDTKMTDGDITRIIEIIKKELKK
jgi:dTDP-4-amino-4,6-dideoxygalactose transaminase